MKAKNLLNRDYYGNSRPTVTNDRGCILQVQELPLIKGSAFGAGYEIARIDSYQYRSAKITDTNGLLFIYSPTAPKFKSKVQAVRYMIENAEFLA